MNQSCFVLVGEKSGEEHLLSFFPELKQNLPQMNFWGVGGDEMREHGIEIKWHYQYLGTMGFSGVITKLKFYIDLKKQIVAEILNRKTKFVLLVDYQGLNYQIAKELSPYGIKIFYYVAPQVWAWKPWRAKVLSGICTKIFSILPFEKQWWTEQGFGNSLTTVDHPLLLKVKSWKQNVNNRTDDQEQCIVFLPGSRNGEVSQHLPIFASVAAQLKISHTQIKTFCIFADNIDQKWKKGFGHFFDVSVGQKNLDLILSKANIAVAASGTITLNLALYAIPTIVCYKVSLFNAFIYRAIVPYAGAVSLPNIILKKWIFPELLQEDCSADKILFKLEEWLSDSSKLAEIKSDLTFLYNQLLGEYSNPCRPIMACVEAEVS